MRNSAQMNDMFADGADINGGDSIIGSASEVIKSLFIYISLYFFIIFLFRSIVLCIAEI